MKEYLMDVHGFQDENMTMLLDDKIHTKPTRRNITGAFKQIVKDSEPGDVVFIHFSGHGGKVKDYDGDEGTSYTAVTSESQYFCAVVHTKLILKTGHSLQSNSLRQ